MDPLQTLILQVSIGLFTAIAAGTFAAVLLYRALRVAARVASRRRAAARARQRNAEEARLAAHVDQLLAQRIVKPLECDTVILPPLTEAETRLFAAYERQMAPTAQYYVFPDRRHS